MSDRRYRGGGRNTIERLSVAVVSRPWLVAVLVSIVTAVLAFQLRGMKLEMRPRDQLPGNDPHNAIEDLLKDRFSRGRTAVIGLEVDEGDIFRPATLSLLQRLTEKIASLDGIVPSTVLSLASPEAKLIEAREDGLHIAPVLEEVPTDAAALKSLRKLVFSHPMYVGNLVTRDGRGAVILADFREDVRADEVQGNLEAVVEAENGAGTKIFVSGQTAFMSAVNRNTRKALPLILLAVVVIAVIHYEAFRTGQAVVLPLVTAIMSTLWGMGLIVFLGFDLDPWTTMTSILILSVAAGHAVQILKRYYECYQDTRDNRAAVVGALASVGPAMVTAGVVAAIGFATLTTSSTPAVRNFGLTAAFGILSALLIELTFIPACRILLPVPRLRETEREQSHRVLDRVMESIGRRVCARPRGMLLAAFAVIGVASMGIPRIEINSSLENWFSQDDPFLRTHEIFNEKFDGAMTIQITVEGKGPDRLLDPRVMQAIDALQAELAEDANVGATLSVTDFLKVMNRAMQAGGGADGAFYRVPDSRDLIAQYLLLYDPADLDRVITTDYSTAVIRARSSSDDLNWAEGLFQRLRARAEDLFPPDVAVGVAGGRLADQAAVNRSVVQQKLKNMVQVSTVIFVVSALAFQSITAALLVLIPVLCAAIVALGLMGWTGTWLTFGTATYAALGISLGADFAIYLLFRLREEMRSATLVVALNQTLQTSGKAIFFVSSAIAAGYAVLLISDFPLWRQLGFYVALMMSVSALTTVTVLPSLVLLGKPRFLQQTKVPEDAVSVAGEGHGRARLQEG